jgi:hypothetical protein
MVALSMWQGRAFVTIALGSTSHSPTAAALKRGVVVNSIWPTRSASLAIAGLPHRGAWQYAKSELTTRIGLMGSA